MIQLGKYNELKVIEKREYGFMLSGDEEKDSDGILLPSRNIVDEKIEVGDNVEVFVYRDSSKRLVATQKKTKAVAGEVAILQVCDNTEIGSFVDIGLDRDVLVPFKEKKYQIFVDEMYPFYIYVDKSERLAATTYIENHLKENESLQINDICSGYVFGFQKNGTALICIEPNIYGLIVKDEYYRTLKEGDYLKDLRVIKIYEDGKVGLSTRAQRGDELSSIEKSIISYMQGNDGFMRFNDKSDPEELRIVFNTSKKNFKRTLGTMMKKNIIRQDEEGTWLL